MDQGANQGCSTIRHKAAELAAILKDKKITCIVIETPNGHHSIDEITFDAGSGTASFVILETARIIRKMRDKGTLITTYAGNSGVKIEYIGP
jgi:hypothetical protein